ncbi:MULTISPECIES: sulfite exporter TauE/SafE family protein [unclassified Polaribacter]|uniref:sulfite exporter TauE/SafE family protein n=1 Tax=unclassified Polaribacter TaxID=196858 RepID=UPI0011BECEC8|nr:MULTISPECIES: sulfite exporter TauE/SafE family protein [unclassified Polaribacter]TXD53032.1 sulfite exporter TauE/SafE family protein [Polaribacter sp. IC063]TXD59467.1 sulfite exporter TauE/SafE family protein [Polaribacter sp. IC066]
MIELFTNYSLVIFLFFLVSILYSSVGFGGGSSYLAILALTGIAFTQIRATSLLCNIVVVFGNVYFFHKQKEINWKKIIPIVICSIPLSFLGGYLKINQQFFFILLGFTLLFAAITMWISKSIVSSDKKSNSSKPLKNGFYGGFIGFISGMVGIGGGIFLAPILHLTNWDTPKKIAATASFFILVNSIAGLVGQYISPDFYINWNLTFILLITVFMGGQIGSRMSKSYFTPIQLKKATAVLIAFVSLRILWNSLF